MACAAAEPFCVANACGGLGGEPWTSSSSSASATQTIQSLPGPADAEQFTYSDTTTDVYSTQTFTYQAVATSLLTLTYAWQYTGYHAFFRTSASLEAFANGPGGTVAVTLVPAQSVGGGFNFSGTGSLTLTPGYTFGFVASGVNFDSDHRLLGTLTITAQ
jgi:hypothetical protein